MTDSKQEQIIALALEVLEDAEMSRTSVESMVLKASRLARLVGDEEAGTWLWHERYGYEDHSPLSLMYLGLTNRWIDIEKKQAYFAGVAVHETCVDNHKEELDIVKKFIPSGDWAASQYETQKRNALEITNKILFAKRIVSAVRGQIRQFATRVYHEHLFSARARTIFETYQEQVDTVLAAKAGIAFDRMPKAFERLSSNDPEAISHALTTCRRVIDSFSNAIFPARQEPAIIGGDKLEVGEQHTRNRLRAYIYERVGKCSRYERLNKTLGSLYDRVSTGVHADVDAEEAKALVLQTYLFLGELLSLPDSAEQPKNA